MKLERDNAAEAKRKARAEKLKKDMEAYHEIKVRTD